MHLESEQNNYRDAFGTSKHRYSENNNNILPFKASVCSLKKIVKSDHNLSNNFKR